MLGVGLGAVTTLPPALLDLLRGGGGADAAEEVRRRGAERLQRDVTCHSHAQSRAARCTSQHHLPDVADPALLLRLT